LFFEANGSKITNPDYEWLSYWVNPFLANLTGQLSLSGQIEHLELARRVSALLPSLFEEGFNQDLYDIQSTQVPRVGQSASSFSFGLFEGKGSLTDQRFSPPYIYTQTPDQDLLLRFFDNCPNYINLQNGPLPGVQNELYLPTLELLAQEISSLLGPEIELNATLVSSMWDVCRDETAIYNFSSFCSLFSEEANSILEFNEDLTYYYTEGYGFQLNYNISNLLLNDFFTTMQNAIKSNFVQKARLRFGHAETVIPFVSILGLFDDESLYGEPLMYNSSWKDERLWRTSDLGSFATNIMFILYECGTSQNPNYVVKLLQNEKETIFPGCGNNLYCPLETLQEIYEEKLSLNFTQMCFGKNPANGGDNNLYQNMIRGFICVVFILVISLIIAFLLRMAKRARDARLYTTLQDNNHLQHHQYQQDKLENL